MQPSDWTLLGIFCKQIFYVDTCLPFSLRSAPYLFTYLPTALHWILVQNYNVDHLPHYKDNFSIASPANSSTCEESPHAMLALCKKLSIAIKPSKVEGPTTLLIFLGKHLNTISMEASITSERKQALLQELSSLHSIK